MCGIAGVISTKEPAVSLKQLRTMARSIAHRGPDDEGIYRYRGVGFAFRRLAIIDTSSAGHQPMYNHDDSLVIIFNGEIYNYQELRLSLKRKGHRFLTKTDTEVILAAYTEYGPACVEHLNGMFAFAIHDRQKKRIFFARDRFGIKPFYYAQQRGTFSFASEVKALLTLPTTKRDVDFEALNEYFTFQNVLSDRTLFAGVKILPPGNYLMLEEDGSSTMTEYWDPVPDPNFERSKRETLSLVRETFHDSVRRHLISDVPVGSQLSGGLDSASIVSAATLQQRHFKTFTGGFDVELEKGLEMNFDERADAEITAQASQTQHYSMIIRPGDMERILPKLIWHQEDLRVGNSYPNYFINELASKYVKVLHSGTGGDELFAGYAWRYNLITDAKDPEEFDRRYFSYWTRLLPPEQRERLFQPSVLKQISLEAPRESYRKIIARHSHLRPIEKALYFESKTFLHGLLTVEDKVSSAHSIESRVPLLDYELAKLALTIPTEWKVRSQRGKLILRDAVRPIVPKQIFRKKKQGFSAPEHLWFRRSLKQYVNNLLLGPGARNKEFLRPTVVEDVLRQHVEGANHRLLIWSLLSFEWWLRLYMEKSEAPEIGNM